MKKVTFRRNGKLRADCLEARKKNAKGGRIDDSFVYVPFTQLKETSNTFENIVSTYSTEQTGEQADESYVRRGDSFPDDGRSCYKPSCDVNCKNYKFFYSHNKKLNANLDETNESIVSTGDSLNSTSEALAYYFIDLSPKLDYLSSIDRTSILAALEFAYEAHKGQFRKSGEPFIIHPIAVAAILADLKVDRDTVISGLLHDTVEDTSVTFETIETIFGKDVRRIVEGETKFSKLTSTIGASLDKKENRIQNGSLSDLDRIRRYSQDVDYNSFYLSGADDKQCEYLKHIFIAMTEDVRVILVKLADRLHNMRTLEYMSPEKQKKIARETLEIFAPLAHRLGLGRIRVELEDISFRFYYPKKFLKVLSQLSIFKANNKVDLCLDEARICLKQLLEQDLVLKPLIRRLEIEGHTKPLYTIYKKMQSGASLDGIYDLASIRIVVELKKDIVDQWKREERKSSCGQRDPTAQWNWLEILKSSERIEEDFAQISTASFYERNVCYHILGSIHSLWKPIPGKLKDYIAFPKPNGYQSLHTVILFDSKYGSLPLEIQIRTQTMDEIAELGITCRFFLDSNEGEKTCIDWRRRTIAWLKSLRDYCDEFSYSSTDLIDAVRKDLLGHRIFVFTPKGYILDLPKGSTPIDAAYHIHSDLGHSMIGARVNGRFVRLDHVLQNADVIKIVKGDSATGPKPDWIHMARSRTARQKIRRYLRQRERIELIHKGKEELEQMCREMNLILPSSSEILCGLQKLLHLSKKRITLRTKNSSNASSLVQWLESLKSCDEFYISVAKTLGDPTGELRMDWLRLILRFLHIRTQSTSHDHGASPGTINLSKYKIGAASTITSNQDMNSSSSHRQKVEWKPKIFVSRCCLPVIGDEIVGVLVDGDTLMLHRKDCSSTSSQRDSSAFFHLAWKNLSNCLHYSKLETNNHLNNSLFPTRLVIKAKDTVGLLSSIAGAISQQGFSITRSASNCEDGTELATLFFEVLVGHVNDIVSITALLRSYTEVFDVQRVIDVQCLKWCVSNTYTDRNLQMPAELLELPDDILKPSH
ncbi:guanosine-3',5'-bis(diphosphate) 3'-pyrophosphohydrolase [Galdieria sulphuraria]|uniref:Putative GTP diphosphokinase RSH1, chloroplastic n=1 Tax=Galdieria sulphuraria TaxID=130081 RepID=M2X2G3_GALSU|nr:guanosine-3',5'-bis(diphosphate) 3'-pyrophosphohydrolase [Galdieria sulphuraria]EME30575.1 guanosine-3',5'-bis(diphosphate) 3'-pyrophosphohydrolase [Galdieria sulphuraria]|eukprot:XP_005707095.1 guanosine-3',5'-bis(diphosphate) 3'-pyrophosphohydrolase [Galdieria sulphuraria]